MVSLCYVTSDSPAAPESVPQFHWPCQAKASADDRTIHRHAGRRCDPRNSPGSPISRHGDKIGTMSTAGSRIVPVAGSGQSTVEEA
jgi:hypothetical protein